MFKLTVLLICFCMAASERNDMYDFETVMAQNDDGGFYFESAQDGFYVQIHGRIETEKRETFLAMNGTFIYLDQGVNFMLGKDKLKNEPFDPSKVKKYRPKAKKE